MVTMVHDCCGNILIHDIPNLLPKRILDVLVKLTPLIVQVTAVVIVTIMKLTVTIMVVKHFPRP